MEIPELKVKPENCEKHGEFESRCFFKNTWSMCPKCSEEIKEKADIERIAAQKLENEHRWIQRLIFSGIPERFHDRTLETFEARTPAMVKALNFSVSFANGIDSGEQSGRSSVFLGRPGTGKTHLCCGIAIQIMRNGKRVNFTSVLRAIRRVKATWSDKRDETEEEAIRALVSPDLLVLDEVGIQFGSETEKMLLFDALNQRYEFRRPTIFISNLTLTEVKAYLGERIFDRLREDGGEVVTFDWESHRGKK